MSGEEPEETQSELSETEDVQTTPETLHSDPETEPLPLSALDVDQTVQSSLEMELILQTEPDADNRLQLASTAGEVLPPQLPEEIGPEQHEHHISVKTHQKSKRNTPSPPEPGARLPGHSTQTAVTELISDDETETIHLSEVPSLSISVSSAVSLDKVHIPVTDRGRASYTCSFISTNLGVF